MSFVSTLMGSFSTPAGANPTVAMIEAALRHHGIDARYLNCDVQPAALADAVRGAHAMGWIGFNCSLPHKVTVIEHLDGLGASAAVIGAVNCAVRRGEGFVGENTDGKGFLEALRSVVDPAGRSLVVLGAGGAARAIAVEAALGGAAAVSIVNRSRERGAELVQLLRERTSIRVELVEWVGDYRVPADIDILVNATSVGLDDGDALVAVDAGSLRPGLVVADVIPNPPRTRLVREAEERGAAAIDGLGMLVNQGAIALSLWLGLDADRSVMRRALEAALA